MENNNKKPFYKKWWFWLIVFFIICCLFASNENFKKGVSDGINAVENKNANIEETQENNTTTQQNTIETEAVDAPETLESKLQKHLIKYNFDNIQTDGYTLTLNAATTGDAQKSIAEDVEDTYIQNLAPIVYEEEGINNFIFKVTITDSTNKDFSYIFGCSLTKEKYLNYNWATTPDKDISKIFINEGEIYSK